jgi:hypothetical protein
MSKFHEAQLLHHRQKVAQAMESVTVMLRMDSTVTEIRCKSNPAWLVLDIWFENQILPPEMVEPQQFAIWLETGNLYRVGKDFAVEDDPITVEEALKGE